MSRRRTARDYRRRWGLALPVIVVGIILVGVAIFLLTRQADDGGTPQVAVDQQVIDYGYVKFGDVRAFEISVTNTGDGVLRFKKKPYIEVLEGC